MKRIGLTALLRDDAAIEVYERYHAAVWPEVVAANERAGLLRVFIYRDGRRLFMFQEGVDDYDATALGEVLATVHPRTREWIDLMDSLMEQPAGGGGPWRVLPEICALDGAPRRP